MDKVYVCWGPIRGWCGHAHRTFSGAEECLIRDKRRCKREGGYSDRLIYAMSREELRQAKDSIGGLKSSFMERKHPRMVWRD